MQRSIKRIARDKMTHDIKKEINAYQTEDSGKLAIRKLAIMHRMHNLERRIKELET